MFQSNEEKYQPNTILIHPFEISPQPYYYNTHWEIPQNASVFRSQRCASHLIHGLPQKRAGGLTQMLHLGRQKAKIETDGTVGV